MATWIPTSFCARMTISWFSLKEALSSSVIRDRGSSVMMFSSAQSSRERDIRIFNGLKTFRLAQLGLNCLIASAYARRLASGPLRFEHACACQWPRWNHWANPRQATITASFAPDRHSTPRKSGSPSSHGHALLCRKRHNVSFKSAECGDCARLTAPPRSPIPRSASPPSPRVWGSHASASCKEGQLQ